jgi:hypothetical protein
MLMVNYMGIELKKIQMKLIPHRHGKRKRVNHVAVKQRRIIFSSHFVHET